MANKKIKKVQVLIFKRNTFKNRKQVMNWIVKNNYSVLKHRKQPIQKSEETYIVVQRPCCRFNKRTLNPKYLGKGVKGIYGVLR